MATIDLRPTCSLVKRRLVISVLAVLDLTILVEALALGNLVTIVTVEF